MTLTLNNLTRVLIQDHYASRNDAQILERVVEAGHASRSELAGCIDLIEHSGLDDGAKKSALRELEGFLDRSSQGLGKDLFGASVDLVDRLKRGGIGSGAQLLASCRTPAKRESLASAVGSSEKELRQLAKQADLQRVDGLDSKLASVLVGLGVDSVVELAGRNPANLHKALSKFAGSQESWIIKFKCPDKDAVTAMIDSAKGLDRALEFAPHISAGHTSGSAASLQAAKILELADGLDYISESDEPFYSVVNTEFDGEINAANFKRFHIDFPNIDISVYDLAKFWEYNTDPSTLDADSAAKFTALKNNMEANLHDLKFVYVTAPGRVENDIYVVGRNDDGALIGLTAKSIDT